MWNEAIGERVFHQGRLYLGTRRGELGHPIYGPYEEYGPGDYFAQFELGIRGDTVEGDPLCAVIDVTTDGGNRSLALRMIHASELSVGAATMIELPFRLERDTTVEMRIAVTGSNAMLVGITPRVVDAHFRRDVVTVPALPHSDDPIEVQDQIRRALRYLRPYRVPGIRKVRLGKGNDGGYACIDDFEGIDTAFSFGINDDISWDIDAADRGLKIYQFDHTVEDPAPDDDRMIFQPKMITAESGPDTQSLEDLVWEHDKGLPKPNIFLKMDIEGGEWPVFAETSGNALRRIAQIVCELHKFDWFAQQHWRDTIHYGLGRLTKYFAVVHVHANNYARLQVEAGVAFPQVIEVALVNRDLYILEDSDETFPGPLDQVCLPGQPDIYLGNFIY